MSFPERIVERRRRLGFPSAGRRSVTSAGSQRHADAKLDEGAAFRDSSTMDMEKIEIDSSFVARYLKDNERFLEDYIERHVPTQQVELWAKQKRAQSSIMSLSIENVSGTKSQQVCQQRYGTRDIITLQKTLSNVVKTQSDLMPLLHEVAHVIGTGIGAEGVAFYCMRSGGKELAMYVPNRDVPSNYQLVPQGQVGEGSTIAAFTAYSKEALFMADILSDDRFPNGVCVGREDTDFQTIICLPVTLPSEDVLGVFQFTKGWDHSPFTRSDMQMALALVTWVGTTLHAAQVNRTLAKQLDLEDFLLEVSKVIFDDMTKLDAVSEKIMAFTKELVNAERCALFLVNHAKEELHSNLFDEGEEENGKPVFRKSDEIRFPITKGIAGFVARSHEIVNIKDAYSDSRFNREIDKKTGFTTRNILCMPIVAKNEAVGVIQMINKKSGNCFTNADESGFKMFSVFCALALHYSKLYQEMQFKGAQLHVALEQMSLHLRCSRDEVALTKAKNAELMAVDIPEDFESFLFYPLEDKIVDLLPHLFVHMTRDLLGSKSFDHEKIWWFTLTVRKNYRPLPYHNWVHGFNVTHAMYCMLKAAKHRNIFDVLWMKGLLIGCICHDVDHRGYNNTFLAKLDDPLARLYSTSVMEQHHYNHAITILQQENHDIFSDLDPDDYKTVLDHVRHCIMATDLALYVPIQKTLNKNILTHGEVDLEDDELFNMVVSLMMTGADLVAVVKPFSVQNKTLTCIYEEFYNQGDKEKEMGLTPIPMMDRDFKDNQPQDQCGFITFICEPCYKTLSDIFPEFSPLLEGCRENFQQWQRVIAGKSTSMWEPGKSVTEDENKKD